MREHAEYQAAFADGYAVQLLYADRVRCFGYNVEIPPLRIAPTKYDATRYADPFDLLIEGHVVEVKSSSHHFTGDTESFPFANPMVMPAYSWESREPKPVAVVLVSQQNEDGVLVVHSSTRDHWITRSVTTKHGDTYDVLACPRAMLWTEDEFLRSLLP